MRASIQETLLVSFVVLKLRFSPMMNWKGTSLVKKRVILTLICGTVILVSGFLSNILKRRSFKSSDMSALLSGRKTLSMSKRWDKGKVFQAQEKYSLLGKLHWLGLDLLMEAQNTLIHKRTLWREEVKSKATSVLHIFLAQFC